MKCITNKLVLVIGMYVFCIIGNAEVTTQSEEVTPAIQESVKVSGFTSKITGMFYTATQYAPFSGNVDAWNLARLGYQFTDNFNLSYNQILLNDYRTKQNAGFNFRLDDAYLRLKWGEIVRINGPDMKIALEQRYYIPTSSGSSDRTLMTGVRNRFLTSVKMTETFSLGLEESPILFWYRDSATDNGPNELIRNYAVLTPTLTGMKGKLNFFFPIYVQNSVYRKSFGENNQRSWKHQVFIWPEVTYTVNDNLELGLTAVTGSFVSDDFAKLTVANAFRDVTSALEVTLSL